MAKLVFPVLPDGLLVDVVIGLDAAMTAAQLGCGRAVTAPVVTCGEIDTGSNITAVSTAILRQLRVPALYQATTQTAGGLLSVDVFKVSVGIRNLADPAVPELVVASLLVMELTTMLPQIDVLIGLDFMLDWRFQLDGPARQFSLES